MEKKQIVGYEVHTLDQMIRRYINTLAEKDELTRMQGWIIGFLYEHPDQNVFQRDIEAHFHIARSTATCILQAMEKHGFLYRENIPDDARLKRLVLTKKGIGHQLTVIQNLTELEHMLRGGIPPEKLDTFFEVIRQMKHNVENHTSSCT